MNQEEKFTRTFLFGGVNSSFGYRVNFNDRSSICYRENKLVASIGADLYWRDNTFLIYPNYLTLKIDGKIIPISNDLREIILDRVERAAHFYGYKTERFNIQDNKD